jgi:hypothetical protein
MGNNGSLVSATLFQGYAQEPGRTAESLFRNWTGHALWDILC